MTTMAHIKHFLNPEGMAIFPKWFENTGKALKQQPGFESFRYALDKDDPTCVHLWVEFASMENICAWCDARGHVEAVAMLDPYRTKPHEAKRYEVKDKIAK